MTSWPSITIHADGASLRSTHRQGGVDGMKRVANGAGRIIRRHHGGDRRNPVSARLDHLSRIRGGDPSDTQDRQPDVPSDLSEPFEADRRSIGCLGWGEEQRTQHDEVGPVPGFDRLLDGVTRDADQSPGPEQAACLNGREARLGEMDAVNREGQGQIDAVIDEEDGFSAVHDGQEPLRQFIEGPCGEVFFAKLDGYRAALKRGVDYHLKGPTPGKGAVGDDIKAPRGRVRGGGRGVRVQSSPYSIIPSSGLEAVA